MQVCCLQGNPVMISTKVEWLVRLGLTTKLAPSRSPILCWCCLARVAKERLHQTEVPTHIQCNPAGAYCKLCTGRYSFCESFSPVSVIRNTQMCALIISQEKVWLRVLARPEGNKEGLSLCPSLSVWRTLRILRTFTGQRSNSSFTLQFLPFPHLEWGYQSNLKPLKGIYVF